MAPQITPILDHAEREVLPVPALTSMVDSAHMEFQTCLQLLAERARFLTGATGVAIALRQDEELNYCAAAGDSVPEPGAAVETNNEAIRECMKEQQAVVSSCHQDHARFALTVPVMRNGQALGFLRLEGEREFDENDIEAATRLAELANVAIEHREAAERAEALLSEVGTTPHVAVVPPVAQASEPKSLPGASSPPSPGEVYACAACGFPVSPGRTLCVECDQKPGATTHTDLFATAVRQESWISAHGYTIATLLTTALTAAIIYWLRK